MIGLRGVLSTERRMPPAPLLRCAALAQVQFGTISEEVVDQLVAEEATYSCAGGLMVEHPLVAPLITAQFGEQASIMGLPKGMTLELLHKAALMGGPKRTVK
jgi:predicted house-cleaning NTP pyrophosphatase (Maf/HAM1 superfamily)